MKKNRETFLGTLLLGVVLLLLPLVGWGQTIFELPKPTQFEAGVPRNKLAVVKEIPNEFGDEEFMATPLYVTANKSGTIYVFDSMQSKIFMFNQRFEYLGKFLESGRGPAEAFPGRDTLKMIYAGQNQKFYVQDTFNDKIIEFSESGKYLRDMKTNRLKIAPIFFLPVVDKGNMCYAYSLTGGIVDQLDNKMKVVHSYLKEELNERYIYYRPDFEKHFEQSNANFKKNNPGQKNRWEQKKIWLIPSFLNVKYDLTSSGLLLIYLMNSATVYLFDGKKLVRSFPVWVDNVLTAYKEDVDESLKISQKVRPGYVSNSYNPMFNICVVDQDEPFFYLQNYHGNGERFMVYQVDLYGKLVKIISFPLRLVVTLHAKKNGLFYCLAETKEEKSVVVMKLVDQ